MAGNDWERLRMTGNDWEARQQDDETARQWDNGTTGRRDGGTARLQDDETTRQRDNETTGPRDHGTARPQKKCGHRPQYPEVPKSRSPVKKPSRSQSCVAARGSLASEWCRCGAKSKFGWMGVYLAYIPIQTNELGAADVPLSRQGRCAAITPSCLVGEVVRCGASQKKAPRDSTKTYSPWCFTFWDVPQMRPYHAKHRL